MERPSPLSANVIGSFAYTTVKDRLPVILTRVIDYLCREKLAIIAHYGEDATDGLKEVIARLSQLKNEMQTNKPLLLLPALHPTPLHDDTELWNACIGSYCNDASLNSNRSCSSSSSTDSLDGSSVQPRWFTAPWLLVECYMYKRIHHSLQATFCLRDLDPFVKEKWSSLQQSRDAVVRLEQHTLALLATLPSATDAAVDQALATMLQLAVWGNQCDLSLSGGKAVSASLQQGGGGGGTDEAEDGAAGADRGCTTPSNPGSGIGCCGDADSSQMQTWLSSRRQYLLVDDSSLVCGLLRDRRTDDRHVAVVLDNAGYELLTDVCLTLLLLKEGLAPSVVLYVKTRPWFVSDTLTADIDYTLQWLTNEGLSGLSGAWRDAINSGALEVRERRYWTTADSFPDMEKTCPEMLQELAQAKLIIFKGDLNYRKLVSDLNWPTSTPLLTAVGPSLAAIGPLLALRTVKGGPVVGVQEREKDRLVMELGEGQWDTTGQCGMIQLLEQWVSS